jgi:hypothetical protein
VLRGAIRGLLPESVRQRSTKADFGHLFAETFRRHGGERFFANLTIAGRGWVDAARTVELYRRFGRDGEPLWPLCMIWAVEIWHRALFVAPSSALKCPEVSSKVTA